MAYYNEKEKLWCAPKRTPLYNPNVSLGQVLLQAMKKSPRNIAQISANNGVQYTYEELHLRSVRAAQNIQKLNFKKGDIVTIVSKNCNELTPITVALLSIGLPYNALDPSFTETELTHMLTITKPKLVFSGLESYDAIVKSLRNVNNEAPIYTFEGQIGKSFPVEKLFAETGRETEFIPPEICGDDIAVIICSSGTTGPPKAICLNHALLLEQIPKVFDVTSDDVAFGFSTLYWISGLTIFMLCILSNATRLITTERFSGELMLQLIERYKITFVMSAPYQILTALKTSAVNTTDLTSVTRWITAGSKMPLDASVKLSEYIPNVFACSGYGMTELGGFLTLNYPFVERDCVGKVTSGSQIKIVDDSGNRLGVDESGEICVKMDMNFRGYYGNKEATDALYDGEGFVKMGDIGFFDADGLLHVTDRKKDFLKYCNYMISPSEIEEFLIGHPDVASVCVVGIKDRVVDDLPAAVIVRKAKATITEQEISEMVEKKFADSRKLRGGVYFVDSLPLTASGKQLRRDVQLLAIKLYNSRTK